MHRPLLSAAAGTAPLVVAALGLSAPAPSPQDALQGQVRSLAQGALLDDDVRGLSIVVAIDDERVASVGEGIAGCDPERAEATTRYAAGGLVDLLFALSAARLSERDALDLDAPVTELLEGFPFADAGITVRQLLAHTSGLPSLADLPDGGARDAAAVDDEEAALLARLGALPLTAEPGTCQEYSSGGVLALGLVLEAVSGLEAQALVAREVLTPLGLEATAFDGPSAAADTEFRRFLGGDLFPTALQPLPFGAERLRTTADDLASLGAALGSPAWEGAVELLSSRPEGVRERTSFGHGLVAGELEQHPFLSFGAASDSCAVQCAFFPDLALTVAVCASTGEAPVERLERRVARLVYGLPEPGLRDLPLPDGAAALYAGEYLVGCNSHFVTLAGDRLHLALPEGREFDLLNQGEHAFVSAVDPDVRLEFEVVDGRATQFFLEERGARSVGKRLR